MFRAGKFTIAMPPKKPRETSDEINLPRYSYDVFRLRIICIKIDRLREAYSLTSVSTSPLTRSMIKTPSCSMTQLRKRNVKSARRRIRLGRLSITRLSPIVNT